MLVIYYIVIATVGNMFLISNTSDLLMPFPSRLYIYK